MTFRDGQQTEKIQGANVPKLQEVVKSLAQYASDGSSGGSSSSSVTWNKSEVPRGYSDVTEQVDLKGLELLNADDDFGTVRTLVDAAKPSALDSKGKQTETKDWVESDTDEQLMLFVPFQATLKIHTLRVSTLKDLNSTYDADNIVDHFAATN